MSHVFISYVRENQKLVDRLCAELRSHGIEVWLDRESIDIGVRWKTAIRSAIKSGAYFIACFSSEYASRERTYMNEELNLAIDELRMRPKNRAWFIPALLSKCQTPDWEIGGGENLQALQWVNLYEDWDANMSRIVNTIKPGSIYPKRKSKPSTLMYTNKFGFQILMIQAFADRPEWGGPSYHCTNPRRRLKKILKVFGYLKHPVGDIEASQCIDNAVDNILELNPDIIGFGGMGNTTRKIRHRLKDAGYNGEIDYWGADVGMDACEFLRRHEVTSEDW